MEIVIATRKSILAQVQADKVGKLLEEKRNLDYKKLLGKLILIAFLGVA